MHRSSGLILCLLLAACSEKSAAPGDPKDRIADGAAGPKINVSNAPGVAFAYRFSFELPPTEVAAAQEAHQQACERLGITRCRITGWRYEVFGQNNIVGRLSMLLDPAIARGFGKDAVASVVKLQGSLREAEITGTDAADAIKTAQMTAGNATAERARIDRQLARADLKSPERAELQAERSAALDRTAASNVNVDVNRATLAATPMTFDYQSGPVIRGFDASAPIASAANLLIGSAQVTFAFVLSAAALLGPPGLVLLLIWFAVRETWRRFRGFQSRPD